MLKKRQAESFKLQAISDQSWNFVLLKLQILNYR